MAARDAAGLIHRVLHRFEPHRESDEMAGKQRAIADRRDRRVGRLEPIIDNDSIVAGQARLARQPVLRQYSDPDDRQVGRQSRPVRQFHLAHRAAPPMQRDDADAKPEPRAKRLMGVQKESRDLRGYGSPHRAGADFHDRHVAAKARRRRRDL
jgi:hypothetical protein